MQNPRSTLRSAGAEAAQEWSLLPQATLDKFSLAEGVGITWITRSSVIGETCKTWCSRRAEQEEPSGEAFTVFLRRYVEINILHVAPCTIWGGFRKIRSISAGVGTDVGCSTLVFCRDTAPCPTRRGKGTPDALHTLSYKCLGVCCDLRDAVRVKPSFPHDIT